MLPMRSRKNSRTSSTSSSTSNQKILNKLLDFLDSSIWVLPIETFIEQQSIVFDRQQDDSDLYMKVHLEFGNLVDTLLECFCEDTGIRAEELVSALEKIDKEKLSAKAKAAYEPLSAAQNYAVFVPMMMRKNVELQLQALQMIEFMCGIIPTVLKIEDSDSLRGRVIQNLSGEEAEKFVLITVLKQSKDEFDAAQLSEKKEIEAMLRDEGFEKDRVRLTAEAEKEGKEVEAALALPVVSGPPPSRRDSRPPLPVLQKEENVQEVKEEKEKEKKKVEEKEEKGEEEKKETKGVEKKERAKSRGREDSREKDRPVSRAPSAKGDRKVSMERKSSAVVVTPAEKRITTGTPSIPISSISKRRPSTSRPATAKTKKPLSRKSSSVKSTAEASIDSIEGSEGKKGRTAADIRALLQEGDQLDPEMLAMRAAYLREQRSKLAQMKQAEREKQLAANGNATQERPKTAKAARGMMRGGKADGAGEDIIAARRALVQKLKENV
ncbi:hypothetical protein PMAYCL1PPCAC_29119 [Pristionchus mayeri]|uniref:Cilia- and flagella-associated protein 36 n=1 Tax=Pristionchus mayeri TaxID=1317129 RepID=A0AAN5D9F2_9BILA|nr:hypothetical protein PMAYCL1PPCAC_29119 [Pristionchus mayeri]